MNQSFTYEAPRGRAAGTLDYLRAQGFDRSTHVPFTREYRAQCSQCEALVINGVATHETGCPNARHECKGCNELIPVRQRYCAECSK